MGAKGKIKLTFSRFLDNPLSKYLIFKFLVCNSCFGLLKKLKKGLGTVFVVHFLHTFRLKRSLFTTLLIDQVSISDLPSFLKLVSNIFYQIFIFSPNDSPSKTVKNVFISSKKLFSFSIYSNFRNFSSSFLHFPDSKEQMEVE